MAGSDVSTQTITFISKASFVAGSVVSPLCAHTVCSSVFKDLIHQFLICSWLTFWHTSVHRALRYAQRRRAT